MKSNVTELRLYPANIYLVKLFFFFFLTVASREGIDFCSKLDFLKISGIPTFNCSCCKAYPVDIGRKLNVHKTFRRRPGRLLNVLCTFNLRPVSTGYG